MSKNSYSAIIRNFVTHDQLLMIKLVYSWFETHFYVETIVMTLAAQTPVRTVRNWINQLKKDNSKYPSGPDTLNHNIQKKTKTDWKVHFPDLGYVHK